MECADVRVLGTRVCLPHIWLPVHPKCRTFNNHLAQTPANGSGPLLEHPGSHSCFHSAPGSPTYDTEVMGKQLPHPDCPQEVGCPSHAEGHGVASQRACVQPGLSEGFAERFAKRINFQK